MPKKYTTEDFVAAFWAKVEKTPTCWIWKGRTLTIKGELRGYCWKDGRHRSAHKVALELKLGRLLLPKHQANHTCDNTLCVRNDDEAHLYEGTQAQNVRDMHERGRATKARGSSHGRAKLTEDQVREIKTKLAAGDPPELLADEYPVSLQNIMSIATGRTWSHVIILATQDHIMSEP